MHMIRLDTQCVNLNLQITGRFPDRPLQISYLLAM